jgi:hypothetical protein
MEEFIIDWNLIISSVLQSVLVLVLPALAVTLYKFVSAQAALIFAKIAASKPESVCRTRTWCCLLRRG